jgi:hypothetical protein
MSTGEIEDEAGQSYEGHPVPPDVLVPDRPAAAEGAEDAIVEAGLRALAARKSESEGR